MNFSLQCTRCDAGDGVLTYEHAAELGWTELEEDADGLSWNQLGLCPDCKAEEDKRYADQLQRAEAEGMVGNG